ncbi:MULTISPECIES: hypothetical protein [unclassified Nocardia]|uniref:hypothetical protein n=1 Tax=unclassified Nocardia TaxID=2637762 RepID=UPI001CE437C8|nr:MULTISPECIES: hypothetical protein [unclassified Nocardia]
MFRTIIAAAAVPAATAALMFFPAMTSGATAQDTSTVKLQADPKDDHGDCNQTWVDGRKGRGRGCWAPSEYYVYLGADCGFPAGEAYSWKIRDTSGQDLWTDDCGFGHDAQDVHVNHDVA